MEQPGAAQERQSDASFWRRALGIAVLLATLPLTWVEIPGCEAPVTRTTGFDVITRSGQEPDHVLVLGSLLALALGLALASRVGGHPGSRLVLHLGAMASAGYVALWLAERVGAAVVPGVVARWPAYVAVGCAGGLALDAAVCAAGEIALLLVRRR